MMQHVRVGLLLTVVGALVAYVVLDPSTEEVVPTEVIPEAPAEHVSRAASIEPSQKAEEPIQSELDLTGHEFQISSLPDIGMPAGPIMTVYERLASDAEAGDSVAAYQLFLALKRCSRETQTEEQLQEKKERLYETRRYRFQDIENPEPVVARMEEWFDYCEGSSNVVGKYYEWLTHSAELGLLQAQISLGNEVPPGHVDPYSTNPDDVQHIQTVRAAAARWLQRAAEAGSIKAMELLAIDYANGVVVPRDLQRAYAYNLIAAAAKEAAGQDATGNRRALSHLATRMRTWEIDEATRAAAEAIQNPNCCKL